MLNTGILPFSNSLMFSRTHAGWSQWSDADSAFRYRALVKIKEGRERPINIVAGGAQHITTKPKLRAADHDDKASYPCHVTNADKLGGLSVHALGRTSGLKSGKISPTMVRATGVNVAHSRRRGFTLANQPVSFWH